MAVSFSNASLHAIETFAARTGVAAVAAQDGSYSFAFERSGILSFIPSEDGRRLILCMIRKPPYPDPARELRALALAGDDRQTGLTLLAGATAEGALALSFVLHDDEIDVPTVLACIDRLIDAQDEVG